LSPSSKSASFSGPSQPCEIGSSISQLHITTTKYLREATDEEKKVYLAHSFRGSSPDQVASFIDLRKAREVHVQASDNITSQEAERYYRQGPILPSKCTFPVT
jgi:hypothetical protein